MGQGAGSGPGGWARRASLPRTGKHTRYTSHLPSKATRKSVPLSQPPPCDQVERPTTSGKGRIDGSPAAQLMASRRLILEAVKTEAAPQEEAGMGTCGEVARVGGAWGRLCLVPRTFFPGSQDDHI